ncbi:hypothetical protein ACI782_15875 [Geodermatophilus sp. SYSU D00703]
MKKIAIAAAAMGGTALIAFGASGTFAALTDTETGARATAGAGTLDLTVGGGVAASSANALSLNPGQSVTLPYWVENSGTVPGKLLGGLQVTNEDRGCEEPEKTAAANYTPDTSCDWGTGGEFSQFATAEFFTASADNAEACEAATGGTKFGTATPTIDQAVQATAAGVLEFGSLAGDAGKCIVLKVTLPTNVTNVVQGDVAQITFTGTLEQQV